MSMNDPLGDMLTRIRNAQMRGKSTVRSPSSKLRGWVLDVLKAEGYIRGYEQVTTDAGHAELEISLKYFEGAPVIRELARVMRDTTGNLPPLPGIFPDYPAPIVRTGAADSRN